MRLHKQHYGFFAVAAACLAFTSLAPIQGLAQSQGIGDEAELARQSDKSPHEWGLSTSVIAGVPAFQSDKNPHEWGLSPEGVAKAQLVESYGNDQR